MRAPTLRCVPSRAVRCHTERRIQVVLTSWHHGQNNEAWPHALRDRVETARKGTEVSTFLGVVGWVLYLYIILILARVVIETTRQFARSWRPVGAAAIGFEVVYLTTDPPIKLLRRLVPPLQLGAVSVDLSILILLLAILALRWVVSSYA